MEDPETEPKEDDWEHEHLWYIEMLEWALAELAKVAEKAKEKEENEKKENEKKEYEDWKRARLGGRVKDFVHIKDWGKLEELEREMEMEKRIKLDEDGLINLLQDKD